MQQDSSPPSKLAFMGLPNRVQAALKSIERGPSQQTELWLRTSIPALGNRSVLETLAESEFGEQAVISYCKAVKGKFF